jgi:hypothetical protein
MLSHVVDATSPEPVSLLSTPLQGARPREHAKAWTTNAARFMDGEHGTHAKAVSP